MLLFRTTPSSRIKLPFHIASLISDANRIQKQSANDFVAIVKEFNDPMIFVPSIGNTKVEEFV